MCIFDKSLDECNESINSTLKKYSAARQTGLYLKPDRPWIWKEYEQNLRKYKNNFEYCVAVHRFPQSATPKRELDDKDKERAIRDLDKRKVGLIKLEPFIEKKELGELYFDVYSVKKRYHYSTKGFYASARSDAEYHERVMHDANCLNYIKDKLKEGETDPFRAKIVFVTCDFRLTRIRRKSPHNFDFIVTVPEFYDYMLPYLFLKDLMVTNPIEMPNFLLASTLSKEILAHTIDFEELFGSFLATQDEPQSLQDYTILSELAGTERFQNVKKKHEALYDLKETESKDEIVDDFIKSASTTYGEYLNKIKESVADSLVQQHLNATKAEIGELRKEREELRRKIQLLEKKKRKGEKFKERQRLKGRKK